MKMIISFREIWENMMNIKASCTTACVAAPHTLVYRNSRIIATNRPPPPVHTQGKQPLSSSGSGRATHRHNRTVARQHNRMQGRFMMSTQYNCAGIDIAKRNFVIAVSSLSKPKPKPTTRKVSPILSSTLKNTTSPSS